MEIVLNIFVYLCIFAMGTLFGSFFSLANYRIPRHEDITHTRSYCPKCKHKLSFFDLIPVLSFTFSLGKCRYCKEKISKRYIILEICNGLFFVLVFFLMTLIVKEQINILIFSMIFYIFYAFIFVIIGSSVMKKRNEKLNSVNNKKGVYVVELVIAFIIFLIMISSSLIVTRNYSYNLYLNNAKAELLKEAQDKLESIKILNSGYDTITSTESNYTKENKSYHMKLDVTKYQDMKNTRYDLIKILKLTLSTEIDGKTISCTLEDLVVNYNRTLGV